MWPARSAAKHPGCCGMSQQAPATGRVRSCSCSSIRTVTVGPGFSPDQPDGLRRCGHGAAYLQPARVADFALLLRAAWNVTASEGFRLALNRYLGWEYRSAFRALQGDTFRDLVHFPGEHAGNVPANRRFGAKKGGILRDAAH